MNWADIGFLLLIFLMLFGAIVAGAHYERWLKRKDRRQPRVMDPDWRGW